MKTFIDSKEREVLASWQMCVWNAQVGEIIWGALKQTTTGSEGSVYDSQEWELVLTSGQQRGYWDSKDIYKPRTVVLKVWWGFIK